MKKKIFTALGLMSGTSMDGVDVSLIKSDGYNYIEQIYEKYYRFSDEFYKELIFLREVLKDSTDLKKNSAKIDTVEKKFTLFNVNIINEFIKEIGIKPDLIGFHGQTIFHQAKDKISKQIGDGKLLSQLTQTTVVYNFRQNDIQNGGEGAPLAPIFHQLLTTQKNINLPACILNIGGISNITIIEKPTGVNGFTSKDIGPGNCLIDDWVRKSSDKQFDKNGDIAKSGKVDDLIYNQAIDNFSKNLYLQSLDINDFDVSFVKGLSLENGCATLTKFSAYLIAKGIEYINDSNNFLTKNLVCGGGRKNKILIEKIKNNLTSNINLKLIDDYKINGDFIESQAFHFLQ